MKGDPANAFRQDWRGFGIKLVQRAVFLRSAWSLKLLWRMVFSSTAQYVLYARALSEFAKRVSERVIHWNHQVQRLI